MLAHGIRSHVRPATLAEALERVAGGGRALGGGTRLLATRDELADVVDLGSLGWTAIGPQGADLRLGGSVTLQHAADSEHVQAATAGLLGEACRFHSASRMLRSQATLAGEAVQCDPDSEVVAALLALNAIFVVETAHGQTEVPAMRFLRDPAGDLGAGGLVTAIVLPARPGGIALERVAVLPSAPPLISVAATVTFAGGVCSHARAALTGLSTPPARVLEAEPRLEGSACEPSAIAVFVEQVLERAPFRDDAHASADYRRRVAGPLLTRAFTRAAERARDRTRPEQPRPWAPAPVTPPPLPVFESGPIEVEVNGTVRRGEADAGTALIDWLRTHGLWGVKHGCETGECGACAVLLDGQPVTSCLTLAVQARGRRVRTVEGLGRPDRLHPVQQAFVDTGAIQCGYCTPAMELLATALLEGVADPTETEVRDALGGCLCRCTGYVKPVEAVLSAARASGGKS